MTYDARVRVPAALTALMSAVPVEGEATQGGRLEHVDAGKDISGTRVFGFNQKVGGNGRPWLLCTAVHVCC